MLLETLTTFHHGNVGGVKTVMDLCMLKEGIEGFVFHAFLNYQGVQQDDIGEWIALLD